MTVDELCKAFVRIEPAEDGGLQVFVNTIQWPLPYEPTSQWVLWRELSALESEGQTDSLALEVIRDNRYFGTCNECGERNPRGWMHGAALCQGCAQENHQVVY